MSYKINKNLLFAALVSCFVLSTVQTQAQGTVTLVLDEDEKSTQAPLPTRNETTENTNDALITPPFVKPSPADARPQAPATKDVESENLKGVSQPKAQEETKDEAFSLNLETQDKNDETPMPIAELDKVQNPTTQPAPDSLDKSNLNNAPSVGVQNQPAGVTPASQIEPLPKSEPQFGDTLLSVIDNDLFNQMSDIEKQTTLLTLELRRERLRNELEAVKEQRTKAREEKLAAEQEKKRKEFEWKKEQEAKVLREQQALKEKEIALEKLKQKKSLNLYMHQMLQKAQAWITEKNNLYKKMREVEEDRRKVTNDFKEKLESLTALAEKSVQTSNDAKSAYDRTIANLTTQIAQLKKRLEAAELAAKNKEKNSLGGGQKEGGQAQGSGSNLSDIDLEIAPVAISKEYAILDIVGKGENLSAKLINKDGQSFQVRVGTTLQTGHTVEQINKTFILFDKKGLKDYLYTSVTPTNIEPQAFVESSELEHISKSKPKPKPVEAPVKSTVKSKSNLSTKGIPSLGNGMFVK